MAKVATKFSLLTLRGFEWTFAVILLGIFGYFVSIQCDLDVHVRRETVEPLVASALAVFFTTFTLATSIFSSKSLQYAGSFLDFVIFALYITAAGLYRHNFHVRGWKNPLQHYLVDAKRSRRLHDHHKMINGLVKLGAGLIILQLILYFITCLVAGYAAYSSDATTANGERPIREKRASWFSSNRSSRDAGNAVAAAEPAQRV